jgi:hypothetical protein
MQYKELAANATTTLKIGPGYLQGITVNNAGSAWTIEIFDKCHGFRNGDCWQYGLYYSSGGHGAELRLRFF